LKYRTKTHNRLNVLLCLSKFDYRSSHSIISKIASYVTATMESTAQDYKFGWTQISCVARGSERENK